MVPNFISEDRIEKSILGILTDKMSYRHVNCYTADAGDLNDKSGRADKNEVVFFDILKAKAKELNSKVSDKVIDEAVERLTRRRSAMNTVLANKEVYNLIRDGIPVEYENANGKTEHARVMVIDFNRPHENDFLAVS